MFPLPEAIKNIFSIFKKNGFEIYLVGGAVRDFLLGKNPKNFDFTTNATQKKSNRFFQILFITILMVQYRFR